MSESSDVEARDDQPEEVRHSRRRMLKIAGVGAAATAGTLLLSEGKAFAANGDPITAGGTFTETLPITLSDTSSGFSAMKFSGTDAPDIKLIGTGRLAQAPALSGTAQPTWSTDSTNFGHEIARTNDGVIWATRGTSSPFSWARLNAVRVDAASGSGAVFNPARIIDTRSGSAKAAHTTTKVAVAGHGGVPTNAIAVFGNLTAVAPSGSHYASGGYLTLFPTGSTLPTTSNLNISSVSGLGVFANFFVCGLGTSGELSVYTAVTTHFLIDVFAYIQ